MQTSVKMNKAGVSLIAVLLFMLVATIAATATWKWITSEGFSSTSRMLKREAYQSSMAGIENARTWMAFHGNDVGALIKAYLDGNKKPINLDGRLRPLQRAGQDYHVWLVGVNTEKSTYKLKILSSGEARGDSKHNETAIFNVDGLYQVKLPQEHHAVAIPFEYNYFGGSTQAQGHLKAHAMLINGNLNSANPVYASTSLIITGNATVSGNSIGAGGNVCVGGNLDANNGVFGGDFYVGGNADHFTFPSASEAAGVSNANVTGNVYIEGNMSGATTGDQNFQQNLTLNGVWTTNLGAHEASVAGNFCVGPDGRVVMDADSRVFQVGGNVWSDADFPIWRTDRSDNHARYDRIILGQRQNSQVYISTAHPSSDYVTLRNNRTFSESSKYYKGNSMYAAGPHGGPGMGPGMGPGNTWDDRNYQPYAAVPEADDKYYLYKYSGAGQDVDYVVTSQPWGFGGYVYYANYYVGNKVFYTPASGFLGFHTPETYNFLPHNTGDIGSPVCKNGPGPAEKWRPKCYVTPWFKSNGSVISAMPAAKDFDCAESAKTFCSNVWQSTPNAGCDHANYKVNDVLITAYSSFESYANLGCTNVDTWNSDLSNLLNACYENNRVSNPSNLYNGYQVVKVAPGQKSDPLTPLRGKFIIIVEDQLGQQSLPPTTADSYVLLYLKQGGSGTIQPAVPGGTYNYFIYTEQDINGVMFNDEIFSGSVYAQASTCAKVGDFKSREMTFNRDLFSDLASNEIICDATASSCGGVVASSSSVAESSASVEVAAGANGMDSYYISMAPQISVTLESQYKSKEPLPTAGNVTTLNPSFMILPRIIYLPHDPYGKLSDYYNVQSLNGASLRKQDVAVACNGPGALSTNAQLYTEGSSSPLAHGIYKCTASATGTSGAYPNIPFWVVVGAGTRGTPQVSFLDDDGAYEMQSNETKEVKISVPARATDLVIKILCPEMPNEEWSYLSFGTGVTRDGGTCTVNLTDHNITEVTVFTIKTTSAVVGTATFQLLPGEGYIPGSIPTMELFISSSALLNRSDEVTSAEIAAYCAANPDDCPEGYAEGWPDCNTDELWIEPSGTSYSRRIDNLTWSILVGNTAPVTLQKVPSFNECVVIVPTENNSIPANSVEANQTYTLRAIAKAKSHTLKIGFVGNVGASNNPIIDVIAGDRADVCSYNSATTDENDNSIKTCTVDVFSGETIKLTMRDAGADQFNYWKCTGGSCPITSDDNNITSKNYDWFTVSDNSTIVLAHFGESDKHCFFDEFKNSTVQCSSDEIYCIDKCGTSYDATCTGATDENGIDNVKWHLISGELDQIEVGSSGEIHIDRTVNKKKKENERTSVKVMSTVTAGLLGSLKALINVPRATSSYGRSSENIKGSGFMLRSNDYGNDYFMLNLYENSSGYLEAQLWKGGSTFAAQPTYGSLPMSVSNNTMLMVEASLTDDNTLVVRAFAGNYYGYGSSPTEYSCKFDLSDFNSNLADGAHQYVGFSLADPSFKIYGIGWKSESYNAECHDTYPTVKCSFAAVAVDGVIKTDTLVQPWVGHSGWFDSKECTPVYYYYNGSDASTTCGTAGDDGAECTGGYQFSKGTQAVRESNGLHGYYENGKDMKTAKVWLSGCRTTDDADAAWGVETDQQRAHCGVFWTGKFEECREHKTLLSTETGIESGTETTVTLEPKENLRAATLHVTLENTDNNEVEIWLVSESPDWGSASHESHSVKMTGANASFDVMREFATGSDGFNPEEVKQIVLKNHGESRVVVKSITTTCANAIGITNCRAEYNGTSWDISAQITNKDAVSSFEVVASVDNSEYFKVTKPQNDIVWSGNMTYLQKEDNPYTSNSGKHYVFEATIKGNATQTVSKTCSVSPDPIGSASATCSVVGTVASGANFPTFNVNFSGCPGTGCAYEVFIDGESFATGTERTTARHSANRSEQCSSASGCEHTYTVKRVTGGIPFTDCSANFKVVRDANNVPPTVQCGISRDQWNFTTGNVFTSDHLYFIARNAESVDKTYAVQLKQGDSEIGSATLKNWSQMTQVKDLGGLSEGSHTYTLYAMGEPVCEETVVVSDASATCSITGALQGQTMTLNVSDISYLTKNTKMTWTLNGRTQQIECNAQGCWNNTMVAPDDAGTYSYSLTLNDNTVCSDTVDIGGILTCSVSPTSIDKKQQYTFTATRSANCHSCTYTFDSGSESAGFPNGSNTLQLTKTAYSSGTKTLSLTCACGDNNAAVSCSESITISNNESFTCPTDDNPYEWECENNNDSGNLNNFGTNAKCVKIHASKVYVQSSNANGRAFCVNGEEAEMNTDDNGLPTNITTKEYSAGEDGYVTVCVAAGNNTSTQIEWNRCSKPAATGITMDCDESNSTNMTGSNFQMTAGQCYKRTCSGGANWHLTGPVGARMLYKDCNGNTQTHTFAMNWQYWPSFNIGSCTAYFKMDQDGVSDNCWQ